MIAPCGGDTFKKNSSRPGGKGGNLAKKPDGTQGSQSICRLGSIAATVRGRDENALVLWAEIRSSVTRIRMYAPASAPPGGFAENHWSMPAHFLHRRKQVPYTFRQRHIVQSPPSGRLGGKGSTMRSMLFGLALAGALCSQSLQGEESVSLPAATDPDWFVQPDTVQALKPAVLEIRHPGFSNCNFASTYMRASLEDGVINVGFVFQADSSDCSGAIRPHGPTVGMEGMPPGVYPIRLQASRCIGSGCTAGTYTVVDTLVVVGSMGPTGLRTSPFSQAAPGVNRGTGTHSPIFIDETGMPRSVSGRRQAPPLTSK